MTGTDDRYTGLPDDWSDSAREVYASVEEELPDITAAQRALLYEAAHLVAAADAMADRVAVDGLMVKGSQGQQVAHPLLAEARQCRSQAIAALKQLGVSEQASASRAGSSLVSTRWKAAR